ncbi:MAG: FAD-dependent oxidoreductase [Desulfovibrio sp.]|jgi:thioredoxin reductase (NADPH)|nr:FAD-dependent oxidoreductase [Desulfovibrio sp.]
METRKFDIAVIGGGIAGMTAAIYAARANRSCIVLESNITGGLANSTYIVENYPSCIKVHGMELMQKIREQVDHFGVAVEELCEIVSVSLTTQPKRIETEEAVFEARSVIAATGRRPIYLDIPMECEQIHYCAICDGSHYAGKRVIVVGGGNSAFDESLYLRQLGVRHITIVEVMDRFFAAQNAQDALLGCEDVVARLGTVIENVNTEKGKLVSAILRNKVSGVEETIPVDGIFVFLGQRPNSEMFRNVLTLDESGYVIADRDMCTNIPGVFSAGDINVKQFRQLTTAAADGTIAALMADRYICGL